MARIYFENKTSKNWKNFISCQILFDANEEE